MQVHYRNGAFQGQVQHGRRQGPGVLVVDGGSVVVGRWEKGLLEGMFVCVRGEEQYVYGHRRRGLLQGTAVFLTEQELVVGQYEGGAAEGVFLRVARASGRATLLTVGREGATLLKEQEVNPSLAPAILLRQLEVSRYLPSLLKKEYDFLTFLEGLFEDLAKEEPGLGLVRFSKQSSFFGFVEGGKAHGLGFLVTSAECHRVSSIGQFQENEQQGLARIYFHN
jgi:hypothetical protein